MFTGIIEEIGEIKSINKNDLGIDISIIAIKIFNDLKIGDSIAVNGCCQTITKISNNEFFIQAVWETLQLSNLQNLKIGEKVNLERALMINSRLGGHIVSGHIEGLGKILNIKNKGNSTIFEIQAPQNIMKYLVYKGSVTVNGVSLTISELLNDSFKVSVVPHTLNNTTFCNLKTGDCVNLEPDLIAKYIEKLTNKEDNTNKRITLEFLKENGF